LSLRLYLDDCTYSKLLTAKLRAAGHDVLTPVEAGTSGFPDREHFQYAIGDKRVLMTHNCSDFEDLHRENCQHSGIVAIHQENNPRRDMPNDQIVDALRNLEASSAPIENVFHVLNAWR
jgi:predicted nuclease of predicted toxin-antitoxin system